jgi:hypothetical protein
VRAQITTRNRRREAGIALLISIFILLLISIVAIALIVASGTESSLAGNYRSATGVYYAALAGLEEARGRLLPKNSNSFANTAPSFLPAPGTPFAIGNAYYVVNPSPTETAASILTTYLDSEYATEFGAGPASTAQTNSMWTSAPLSTSLNLPGPLYKWVRINAVSEKSLKIDFDGNPNSTTPLYYDGAHFSNSASAGPQVLEITSLAKLPNGSQKILQYVVAPIPVPIPPLPAALTLAGKVTGGVPTIGYSAPASNASFWIKGDNYDCNGTATGSGAVLAIGVFNSANTPVVIGGGTVNGVTYTGIPTSPSSVRANYTGFATAPSVDAVDSYFPSAMKTPAGLEAALQPIIQNKDVVITPTPPSTAPYLGTATGSDLTPLGMSSNNPLTIVVNGNLDISNWSHDGYGLLLVTGTFTYDPDTNWYGIIFVVGQGIVKGSHQQYKQINGAMLVAKTRDGNNNLLTGPDLADSSGVGAIVAFDNNMQGNGIRYSSCWIQRAQPTSRYKILSFHEITQ